MNPIIRFPAAGAVALVLAGCISTPTPTPVTQLSQADCPTLARVTPQPAPVPGAKKPATYHVAAASDCLVGADGTRTTGTLIALPTFAPGYYMDIASQAQGEALLPLRIQTLNGARDVQRTVDGQAIYFRGDGLSGQLFFNADNADERFLLITAAPSVVGQSTTRTAMGAQSNTYSSGTAAFNVTHSFDKSVTHTFSYNGDVTVNIGGYPVAE